MGGNGLAWREGPETSPSGDGDGGRSLQQTALAQLHIYTPKNGLDPHLTELAPR